MQSLTGAPVGLGRLVGFSVDEYNSTVPHAAFRGQTPDEIYCGTGAAVPHQIAAARAAALVPSIRLQCPVEKTIMKTLAYRPVQHATVAAIVAALLIAVSGPASACPQERGPDKKTPGPDEQVLSGSIVAVDESGKEHLRESGRCSFLSRTTGHDKWIAVPVSEGRYEAIVPVGANIEIFAFELGGCPAVPDESEFIVPANGVRDIRARKLKPLVLRVTGEDSGKDLSSIEIRASQGHYENATPEGVEHVKTVLTDATSPVPLQAGTHYQMYWVRSPGYGWQRIALSGRASGEHHVELRRAGSLAVSFEGNAVPDGTRIRLFGGNSRPWEHDLDVPANPEGTTSIQGVIPGSYSVSAELGDSRSPTRLGKASVQIVAGQETPVVVTIDSSPLLIPLVPFRGTIRVPDALANKSFSLWIMSQDRRATRGQDDIYLERNQMTPIPGGAIVLSWDAGEVVPGQYLVTGIGIEHRSLVDVEREGLVDLEIVVPELARVILRIRDKATGDHIQPKVVSWSDGADLLAQKSLHRLSVDPETGVYEFDAPSQRIEISVDDPCVVIGREFADLHADSNEIEIEARRACGLVVYVEGREAADSRSSSNFGLQLFRSGRPTRYVRACTSATWNEFSLEEPGEYEVRFPNIEGYEPIPPRTVTVELGKVTELRIALKKSR